LLENLRASHCCYLAAVRRKRKQRYEIRSDGLDIASTVIGIDLRTLFLKITAGRIIMKVEWRCVNKDTCIIHKTTYWIFANGHMR
jgi:hypothetical protein